MYNVNIYDNTTNDFFTTTQSNVLIYVNHRLYISIYIIYTSHQHIQQPNIKYRVYVCALLVSHLAENVVSTEILVAVVLRVDRKRSV